MSADIRLHNKRQHTARLAPTDDICAAVRVVSSVCGRATAPPLKKYLLSGVRYPDSHKMESVVNVWLEGQT